MSKRPAPSLNLEWTHAQTYAIDTASGKSAAGDTPGDLSSLLSGHRGALVGIGRGFVFLKAVRLPKALPEDLRRILSVRMDSLFPLPPNQLAFDFIQTDDQSDEGFLTLVAAIRTQDLQQLRESLQRANIQATNVLPVALGAVAVASRAGVARAVVVERTPLGLTLDVVHDGIVRFSRMAAGDSDPEVEARRMMAAADSGILPVVAAGGLTLPGATTVPETALGLLAEAPPFTFERSEDRARVAQKRIAARTRFGVLMMAAALLLAALVWVERMDAQAVVTRAGGTWARELSKMRSIRDTEITKAQRAAAIESSVKSAFQPAQPLSDLTAVIADSLPPSVWLTGLTVERGKPIQVRGTATQSNDVAALVDRLGASSRFREVRLVFANSARIEQTPVIQFSITAVAVGNLPMPAPVKAARRAPVRGTAAKGTTNAAGAAGAK
ncbi:MAG: PilN domain-containing protein [Armatimonadota bacterium]